MRAEIAFVLLLALATFACNSAPKTGDSPSASSGGTSQSPQPAHVSLAEIGSASDAGIYIAIEKGFFQDVGLEVERTRFATGADMVAPLSRGQLDVGASAPSAGLLNAMARDIPIKIVADKGNFNPGFGFQSIIVRKDLYDSGEIRGAADMKGRTIALNGKGATPEVLLDAYLRTAGLTFSDADVTAIPFAEMVVGLANKSVDVVLPIEPFVTQILDSGSGVAVARADEILPGQQVAVIMYSPRLIDEEPGVARRFMEAYLRGVRYYNDAFARHDDEKRAAVIDILTRYTPVTNAALYDKMVMPGLNPDGRVNVGSLDQEQAFWMGIGSQETHADLSKVVDSRWVDEAVRRLGPY